MPDVPVRRAARRFTEIVCPPEVRVGRRADRVLEEFGLMLDSLPAAARKAMAAALVLVDQGARLYPAAAAGGSPGSTTGWPARTYGPSWRGTTRPPS